MAALQIYLLNVGQADTSIIKTPAGNVIIIDAYRPSKVRNVLDVIRPDGEIAHLVVTHPHNDHYRAVPNLLENYRVRRVTLTPFWLEPGKPGYHQIINKLGELGTPVQFLSGYQRIYPDGGTFPDYEGRPILELLGPSNSALEELFESGVLNPNHLSIITRLTYGSFNIVFAGDAQMENWDHFDREGMLEEKCDVLRAAHHGSKRGSQWERLERLSPSLVVVSSDPQGRHHLPDLIGSAVFLEYDGQEDQKVVLTHDTGTIKIEIQEPPGQELTFVAYAEGPNDNVFPASETPLAPTDWLNLVQGRLPGPGP